MDVDLDPCIGFEFFYHTGTRRRGHTVVEPNALSQARKIFRRWTAAEFGSVNFADAEAWMRQAQCQLAIIGEQQQAGRIVVKSSDWEDSASFAEPGKVRCDIRAMLW